MSTPAHDCPSAARSGVQRHSIDPAIAAAPPDTVDLVVHAVLRIRIVGGTTEDRALVSTQSGLSLEPSSSEADLSFRFAESLALDTLTYVGLNFAGFDDEHFYVLHPKTGQVALQLPFAHLGGPCEVVCQSGLPSIPLLNDILALYCQLRGFIALHASAFLYQGCGILVAGWAKGGKTEALLAFANHEAHYVGDECVFLSASGNRMMGLPMPVTVADWMAPQVAGGKARASLERRFLFATVRGLDVLHRFWSRLFPATRSSLSLLGRGLPLLRQASRFQAPVRTLFTEVPAGTTVVPKAIFLMLSDRDSRLRVEPIEASEVAARMHHSNTFEQLHLMQYYHAFRFSFPHLNNSVLEGLQDAQAELLSAAFANKPAYKVLHPYPVALERLYEQMRPYCGPAVRDHEDNRVHSGTAGADSFDHAHTGSGSRTPEAGVDSESVIPRTVALVGPDGAGKTTVAQRLCAALPQAKYLYMGTATESANYTLPTSRLILWVKRRVGKRTSRSDAGHEPLLPTGKRRNIVGAAGIGTLRLVALANRLAEEWYRQFVLWLLKARGSIVICDRHFQFEHLPHSESFHQGDKTFSERAHLWCLRHWYPSPDIVVFLDAASELLYARKGEWSLAHLERHRNGIIEEGLWCKNFVTIDASQPLDIVVDEVQSLLLRHQASRA